MSLAPAPMPRDWLGKLAQHPDASIVLCDSQEAADAATRIFPDRVVLSWGNDITLLAGREILVWPNASEASVRRSRELAARLAKDGCTIELVDAFEFASVDVNGVSRQSPEDYGPAEALDEHGSSAATGVSLNKAKFSLDEARVIPFDAPREGGKRRNRKPRSLPVDSDEVSEMNGAGERTKSLHSPVHSPENPMFSGHGERVSDGTLLPGGGMDDEAEIARLASLSSLAYDREREGAAKALRVRITTLDEQVKARREQSGVKEAPDICSDIEPWGEPVNVAELLDEIQATIGQYIICDASTARAAALWIAFSWIIDHVQVAPLAVITAPEKRCGKTQLLDIVGRLSRRPLFASSISPASMFRVIEAKSPTLLIDEGDAFFRENEELRGIVNAGHTRTSAFVIRCIGESFEPKQFSTWGAKAIASIGALAGTIMDRAIVLRLRRKLPHEKAKRLRHTKSNLFETLARKLARFGEDHGVAIGQMRPVLPEELNDRAQDNWEPLLSIAEFAGGRWPKEARRAAIVLSGGKDEPASTAEELLASIRDIFDADGSDRISMADLLNRLCADEMAAWGLWNNGRPMTARQLGKRLGEFGIRARPIHVSHYEKPWGFLRLQFEDAFARYLGNRNQGAKHADAIPLPDTPLPSLTNSPPNKSATFEVSEQVSEADSVAHPSTHHPQPRT